MSDAELLIEEIKTLPPTYREEALDFIGYLKQKAIVAHAAALSRETAGKPVTANSDFIVIPAWKLFGRSLPPTLEETDAAIKEGCGIATRLGSKFSSDMLLENRRRDKEMEDAEFRRWFHKDGARQ